MKPVVLITGGLGYVGGRLARRLLKDARFTVRLGTRHPSNPLPRELLGATAVECVLESRESLAKACSDVDTVLHLASINEVDCAADHLRALEVNTAGTLRTSQAAIEAGVRRFVYFSTAHVYGSPLVGRITEETPCRPIHPYAWSHHAAEDIVMASATRIETLVVRLANAFGAPVAPDVNRWTLLVSNLCREAVGNGGRLVLKSSGLQERNFITLTDVERATSHLLEKPSWDHRIINIGGCKSTSVLGMTRLVAERAAVTLGENWTIERPETVDPSHPQPLDYRCDLIEGMGFLPADDYAKEVDGVLRACMAAFGKNAH
ncbi:MAG TPA: SDR family oxidoreductase [Roseimicrobium sp.]|nr:SDR family oxidoreductase [Roseimicrobium sp.]